jgi:hypothetical protein
VPRSDSSAWIDLILGPSSFEESTVPPPVHGTVKGADAGKPSPSVLEDLNLDGGLKVHKFDPTLYRQQFCAKLAAFLYPAGRGNGGWQPDEMRVAAPKTAAAGSMASVEMPLLNHSVAPTNGATCRLGLRPSGHRAWHDTPSPAREGSVRSVHPRPHAQLRGAGTYGVPGPSWDNGPLRRTAAPLAAYNRAPVLAAMSRKVNAKPVSAPPVKEPAHASVQELQRRKSPGLWLYAGRRMRYSAHMLSEYAINVVMARRCVDGSFMILDGVIGGSLGGVSHQIARLVSGPDTPHRPSAAWNLM